MEETKLVRIEDLQPTDTLRQPAVSFLETLTPDEIKAVGDHPIEVLETPGGLLLTEGHNRVAVLAKKGEIEVNVRYQTVKDLGTCFSGYLEQVHQIVDELRQQGIFTPYDLWAA